MESDIFMLLYTISLPKPHGKHVGARYVKRSISVFEEIKDGEEI